MLDVRWECYDTFNSWTDKKDKMYKPKSFGGKLKVELDLSNYPTKPDLKNAAGVDTSGFAKKNWFS